MAMDERQRVAHLLRRAGFGAGPAELDEWVALGFDASVERLLDPGDVDESGLEPPDFDPDAPLDLRTLQTRWLHRMVHTQRPLVEKLTLFWHGHFATSVAKVRSVTLMWGQNELFRSLGIGRFDDLLLAVSQDPAMLVWLDNAKSKAEAPNENYGRELLELFTLGVGNYTEADVKAAARAFTGWSIELQTNSYVGDEDMDDPELRSEEARAAARRERQQADAVFRFRPRWHDGGEKTFLGQTGDWDGGDIIRIILEQPACATFVARKLFGFFVWDNPDDATVAPFAAVFRESGGDIREVTGAILRSPQFSSDEAYRAKVKSPVELVAGTLRAAGGASVTPELLRSMARMGQVLFAPPNVGGWPAGLGWIGPSALLERYNLVIALLNARRGRQLSGETPALDVGSLLLEAGPANSAELVDQVIDWLLAGDIDDAQRDALLAYLDQTPDDSPLVLDPADETFAGKARGLVRLVTTVPSYQLA
jgi:uncharacterized protein (DUF1800 family)